MAGPAAKDATAGVVSSVPPATVAAARDVPVVPATKDAAAAGHVVAAPSVQVVNKVDAVVVLDFDDE